MADEKKLTSEEITDEKANEAAGGLAPDMTQETFVCDRCGGTFPGKPAKTVNGKNYCKACADGTRLIIVP